MERADLRAMQDAARPVVEGVAVQLPPLPEQVILTQTLRSARLLGMSSESPKPPFARKGNL
jgi:hypothetical protein